MKKQLAISLGLVLAFCSTQAAAVFGDNFNSYSPGNLVGQGGWLQTGTTATSPIQVNALGQAAIGTSGQDVYNALPGGILNYADGSSFYIGLKLNVSAAQATGDYFLHFTPTVGDSGLFFDRLFAKSVSGGYVLGWLATAGTGSGVTYGTTVLSLSTDYRVVLGYNAVSGTFNDTASLYVNPSDSIEGNNTPYASFAWNGGTTSAENHNVAALNLRQGSAGNAPTVLVDDLNASQSFADVVTYTPVPEPSSFVLLLGGVALLGLRRRS